MQITLIVLAVLAVAALAAAAWFFALNRKNAAALREASDELRASDERLRREEMARHSAEAELEAGRRSAEDRHLELEAIQASVRTTVSQIPAEQLAERQRQLSEANREALRPIVEPVERQLSELRTLTVQGRQSLQDQLTSLGTATTSATNSTDELTRALKGQSKIQGDWGETRLEDCLQQSGAVYGTQVTLTDKDGRPYVNAVTKSQMRPVALIYLDRESYIIVDAKTSLTDYVGYFEATTGAEREDCLKKHVASVMRHVKELAAKNYYKYAHNGLRPVEMVLMFVPIEGALQLFLTSRDGRKLWYEAMQQGVVIVGERNLYTAARLISQLWVYREQADKSREIARAVGQMLDGVEAFVARFDKIGTSIVDMAQAFKGARTTLVGDQKPGASIVGRIRRIADLDTKQGRRLEPAENPVIDQLADLAPARAENETGDETTDMPRALPLTAAESSDAGARDIAERLVKALPDKKSKSC